MGNVIMTDLLQFARMVYSGRGILLAGQELEPGASDLLATLIAEVSGEDRDDRPLSKLCEAITDPGVLGSVFESDQMSHGPSSNLRHIAGVPWAGVITSALDDRLSEALAATDSEGRRLRYIFPEQEFRRLFTHKANVLSVLNLARAWDNKSLSGVPVIGPKWRRSERRYVPVILDAMPQLVGLGHVLCIAGIGADDLINFELLEEVLDDLDQDKVYWFVSETDGLDVAKLRADLPHIHIIENSLEASLAEYLSDRSRKEAVQQWKGAVIDLEELLVTVRDNGRERVIPFRVSELREFRSHLVILGDYPPVSAPESHEERRDRFVRFLSLPRQEPDWFGVTEGFVFERAAYQELLKTVMQRFERITKRSKRNSKYKARHHDAPIFLAGPPASGRTVGLHWLGYELRKRKVFTIHLTTQGDTVDPFAIEKIVRLVESRGAPACVVISDRLDRHTVANLDRRLRTAGRRSIVVASATELPKKKPSSWGDKLQLEDEDPSGQEVSLNYRISTDRYDEFEKYLQENGASDPDLIVRQLQQDPSLFALLYRLVPESRENITIVLRDEYQRLVQAMASFSPPESDAPVSGNTLQEQLLMWWEKYGKTVGPSQDGAQGAESLGEEPRTKVSLPWTNIATNLPKVVMLFSSLDQAASLNLLVGVFPQLLRYYGAIVHLLEKSNLIDEVSLDREGSVGLMAVNQMVAKILLPTILMHSNERLDLLGEVLGTYNWNSEMTAADSSSDQSQLVALLRSISPPSGTYHTEYNRTDDLETLAKIYRSLREDCLFKSAQLMRTEGIILRHIGRRYADQLDRTEEVGFYRRSHEILEQARVMVASRPASAARSFEMSAILNTIATTLGHVFNAISANQSPMNLECRELVDEVLKTASLSRAYQDNYIPLDIAFWSNRDLYRRLQRLEETSEVLEQKVHIVNNMANALDAATELESMPREQLDRYHSRLVELRELMGDLSLATELAEEAAGQKIFSGVCVVARSQAIDIETGKVVGRKEAHHALEYLKRFEPDILQDERAVPLLHRLWIGKHLENRNLNEGPHAIGCEPQDWRELEKIVRARNALAGDSPAPYVNFWLAVALAHQGDIFSAMRALDAIQANTFGFGHRRLNPLIYLAERAGKATDFRSVVRRRERNEAITVFVPSLQIEIQVQRRYQGSSVMLNVQRGDEVPIHVGFSYWQPLGIAVDWEASRHDSSVPNTRAT